MALATTVLAATAATNPFMDYKNWKTPHGTYPFNEIHAAHYMPAFEEGMKQGLQDIDAIVWIGFPGAYGFYGVADVPGFWKDVKILLKTIPAILGGKGAY